MKNLSIIIPHKNSFQSLVNLLNSINNEASGVDIIIIDDNSEADVKLLIEREIKDIEKKFKANTFSFLSSEDSYAGGARNLGIKKAHSKWILFADADDYFLPNWFKHVSQYFNSSAELIYFSPTSFNLESQNVGSRHLFFEQCVIEGLQNKKNAINRLKVSVFPPWSKLIKSELIEKNQIEFDQTLVSNDVMFSLKVALHANKILLSNEKIYCVTENSVSLTATPSLEKMKVRSKVASDFNQYLKRNTKLYNDYYMSGWEWFRFALKNNLSVPDLRNLKKYIKELELPLYPKPVFKKIKAFIGFNFFFIKGK